MKLSRIIFLFLLLFLLVPSVASAQNAASKSWQPFWTKFSAVVKSKSKANIKRLMVAENNFLDGGGGETRNQWLNRIAGCCWREIQNSVAGGTVPYNEGDFKGRITKDQTLIFQYTGGRWYFAGVMGD